MSFNQQITLEYLQKFYRTTLRKNPNRLKQLQKCKQFLEKCRAQMRQNSQISQRKIDPQDEQTGIQSKSLRVTGTTSKPTLENRSVKLSRRSDSTRGKSEQQDKYFNCEWVYQSEDPHKIVVYLFIACFITTDNVFSFKTLEDKINDELMENNIFVGSQLAVITREWQRIGEMMIKSKSIRWQKVLVQIVEKLPPQFIKLVYRLQLKEESIGDGFTQPLIMKIVKQTKVSICYFTIMFRQIQKTQRCGNYGSQLAMGYLRHSKTFVIASKIPQYSQEQLKNRQLKHQIQRRLIETIKEFDTNGEIIKLEEIKHLSAQQEKKVKEYIGKRLVRVQGSA